MKFVTIAIITAALASAVSAAPMSIQRRRFGQEHTTRADADFQAMKDISNGTGFEADLGNLSGAAVRALLAKAPACDQQDVADQMIDIAKKIGKQFASSFGPQKQADLIKVAQDYRTLERNTPNAGQPSALCDKQPRNKELKGLVQAQDPTGTPPANNPPANNPPATDPPATDPPANNPPATDPPANNCTANNPPANNPPATDPPANNPPANNPPANPPAAGSFAPGTKITVDNDAFKNPVGGIAPPEIVANSDGNPSVNGDRFLDVNNAIQRACDVQKNQCFNKFNSAPSNNKPFQSSDCENQQASCSTGTIITS